MVEITLTDEEKAAASYFDLDDAACGRFAKAMALEFARLSNDATGLHRVVSASCALWLVGMCVDTNNTAVSVALEGFEKCGLPAGDWTVTVGRKREPKRPIVARVWRCCAGFLGRF